MTVYTLSFSLDSEATSGTGSSYGTLDTATQVDPTTGLPRVPATAVVGLWVSAAGQLLRSLQRQGGELYDDMAAAALRVFGGPGGDRKGLRTDEFAAPPLGDQAYVLRLVSECGVDAAEVRAAAAAAHVQTAVDLETGVGDEGSRRSTERVLRTTPFRLSVWTDLDLTPTSPDARLLGASAALVVRGGLGRRRGAGGYSPWTLCDIDGADRLGPGRDAFLTALIES